MKFWQSYCKNKTVQFFFASQCSCIFAVRIRSHRFGVPIRNPDPDEFRNLLRKCMSVKKNYEDPISFSRYISESVEKCVISQCWRILQKVLDLNPEADEFQNVINSSPDRCLPRKIWWRVFLNCDPCDINKQTTKHTQRQRQTNGTDQQTSNKQPNARYYITSLAKVTVLNTRRHKTTLHCTDRLQTN